MFSLENSSDAECWNITENTDCNTHSVQYDSKNITTIESVIMFSLWLISISCECVALYVVVKSKSTLVRAEYFILLSVILGWTTFKLVVIFNYATSIFIFIFTRLQTMLIQGWLFSNTSFIASMLLTYYSLYHVVTLKRSPIFLIFFDRLRRPKSLLIYSFTIVIFSIIITSASIFGTYRQTEVELPDLTIDEITSVFRQRAKFIVVICSLMPPLFPSIIYFSGVMTLLYTWSKMPKSLKLCVAGQSSEFRRIRRNLSILTKFLFLSLAILIFISCQITSYIFSIVDRSVVFMRYLGYVGDILFMLFQAYLLMVHKILLTTLKNTLQTLNARFFSSKKV